MHAYTHTHTQTYTQCTHTMDTHTHIHTHTRAHTRMHTHTHTHTHARARAHTLRAMSSQCVIFISMQETLSLYTLHTSLECTQGEIGNLQLSICIYNTYCMCTYVLYKCMHNMCIYNMYSMYVFVCTYICVYVQYLHYVHTVHTTHTYMYSSTYSMYIRT